MPSSVGSVIAKNEILLNGERFPIKSPPRRVLTSLFAPKISIGQTDQTAAQHISTLAFNDFRGGIGIERGIDSSTVDRAWFATAQLRFKEHVVLPALVRETAASGESGQVDTIEDLNNEIYAAFGTKVMKWSNTDSWGSSLHTLPGSATDIIKVRLSGTTYLVWACNAEGYSFTSDGSSYTNKADTVFTPKFLAVWNDLLWGISEDGYLKYSSNLTSWTNDAQLPLPNDSVTSLFVGRDASANPVLYANTKVGLFVHDNANTKWLETEIGLPFNNQGGVSSTKWRDSVYFPVGLSVYKYKVGETSTLQVVGPDRDHGLPAEFRGTIKKLVGTHNDLIALIDGTTGTEGDIFQTGSSQHGHRSQIIESSGKSLLCGYNELGWEVKWAGTTALQAATTAHVSSAYGEYRLWFATTNSVFYFALNEDVINPDQISDFEYATSGELQTPDFDANDITSSKLALKLKVQTSNCTSTETVGVSYALDGSDTYTSLGSITTNGVTEYDFPSTAAPAGLEFKSIRFKFTLARGSTSTKVSPDVNRFELQFRRKLAAKYGWQVTIDLTRPRGKKGYKGKTPAQLDDALRAIVDSNELLSYTFRHNDTDYTHYVDVAQLSGFEMTGLDDRFERTLTLLEP
tara:strand:- start:2837 stop:4726 length:1890 start_codon:yes stop_codon:yes gene_type:complete